MDTFADDLAAVIDALDADLLAFAQAPSPTPAASAAGNGAPAT